MLKLGSFDIESKKTNEDIRDQKSNTGKCSKNSRNEN